jgi:ATP-dependent Lhr-like helicase
LATDQKYALEGFRAPVRAWFEASFARPTRAQVLGWPEILAGRSTLLLAPTGSGKTLAAFLAAIDRLMFTPAPPPKERCRVLYVSPLKALAVDVERNLRAPLAGIAEHAARLGTAFHLPEVGIRSGDTEAAERARQARRPPDVLITTPESL